MSAVSIGQGLPGSNTFAALNSEGSLAVAGRLGLEVKARSFGPCPACGAERRSGSDPRPPCSTFKGSGWACKACDAKGDAVTLAAYQLDGDRKPGPKTAAWARGAAAVPASKPTAAPVFNPATVTDAWAQALDGAAREAREGKGLGLEFLSQRLDGQAALELLTSGEVGIVGHRGLGPCIAVPLRDLAGNVRDIQYRSLNTHAFARIGGAADAAGAAIGFVSPGFLADMGGADVFAVEGMTDWLAARALGVPALGLPGASTATALGGALARELVSLRAEGGGGPRRVLIAAHGDEKGDAAVLALARELRGAGIASARVPMPRKPEEKDPKRKHEADDLAATFARGGRDAAAALLLAEPVAVLAVADPEPSPAVKRAREVAERFRLCTIAEVRARIAERPAEWLIKGLWPADAYGVMAGPEKSGKTYIEFDLAVSVASGTRFLGKFECPPGPVAIFIGEGGDRDAIRRLDAICESKGVTLDELPIHLCCAVPGLSDEQAMAVIASQLELLRPRLILLDPLYMAAGGQKLGDLYAMGEALGAIQGLARKAGAALMVVTHFNRAEGSGSHRITGAGPGAWGRVLLMVTPERKAQSPDGGSEVQLRLDVAGGEIADSTFRVLRRVRATDPDDLTSPLEYSVEVTEAAPASEGDPYTVTQRRVMQILAKAAAPLRVRAIGDGLAIDGEGPPLKHTTIDKNLNQLAEMGLVVGSDPMPGIAREWGLSGGGK